MPTGYWKFLRHTWVKKEVSILLPKEWPYFTFMYMHNNQCHRVIAHLHLNVLLLLLLSSSSSSSSSISFMQANYIPETNYVPREHSVAAILLLLFMVLTSLVPVLNLLYFYICTLRSVCAVPNMFVFCSSWLNVFLVCCSRIFWMTLK